MPQCMAIYHIFCSFFIALKSNKNLLASNVVINQQWISRGNIYPGASSHLHVAVENISGGCLGWIVFLCLWGSMVWSPWCVSNTSDKIAEKDPHGIVHICCFKNGKLCYLLILQAWLLLSVKLALKV